MRFTIRITVHFLIVIWALSALSARAEPDRLSVVASIRPLALLAQDLLGEWADVETIVPPNADPHNLSLKVSARMKLDGADLVFWLGPEFERFLQGPMRQRHSATDLAVADIDSLFEDDELHTGHDAEDHHHHARDLHVWLDPARAEVMLIALSARFEVLRPDLRAQVAGRLEVLLGDVRRASIEVAAKLNPHMGKSYGVYHDAYGHFSNAFGLHMVAAVNQLPEQRLSAKHIHRLQQSMKGASCIVVERVSAKTERLAKVLKVKSVAVDPLASDLSIQSYAGYLNYLGDGFERCFLL